MGINGKKDHLGQGGLDKDKSEWDGNPSYIMSPVFFDGGGDMREVDAIYLFDLADINGLCSLQEGRRYGDYYQEIILALLRLWAFVRAEENQKNLPSSVNHAKIFLIPVLEQIKEKESGIFNKNFVENMASGINDFRKLLTSELGKLYIILLEEQGGHSVQTLWKHQLTLLEGVGSNLSVFVKSNFSEAAKCLVLNCYTAVGFHCVRSIEHMARKYYELIKDEKPKHTDGRFKGLGAIARELLQHNDKLRKDEKSNNLVIIASLMRAINKEDRDPLAHPEITKLNKAEAIEIFYDARQVIVKVIGDAKAGGPHFKKPWKRGSLF